MADYIKNQFIQSTFNNPVFNGEKKISKHLTPLPLVPEVFLGREGDLKQVHEKLFQGENLLLVNGTGGIGKTTFASKYYHHYHNEYTHLAWVFAGSNLMDALLVLSGPKALDLTFDNHIPNEQRLSELLQAMSGLEKTCLLVVDNANDLTELEKYNFALKACPNFHVLLTTRVTGLSQANMYPLGALDREKAKKLFTTHYKTHKVEEDVLLEKLLEAVGYNTLVIELLAKNLNNFNNHLKERYSLTKLLKDLVEKGLFGITARNVRTLYQVKNLQMREETPESILVAMYELNDLPIEERELLSMFSVLPAEAITFEQLEALLPNRENLDTTLLDLGKKGWVEYEEQVGTFRISPVIQEIIRKKNEERLWQETNTLISGLIDKLIYEPGLGHYLKTTYEEASVWAHYGAFAAEKLKLYMARQLTEDGTLAILYERLGNYYFTTGNLNKALVCFENYNSLEKDLHKAFPKNTNFKQNLAISYSKLGSIYSSLGKLSQALNYFMQGNHLVEELYEAYPKNETFAYNLAGSYSDLGSTYSSLGNLGQALIFFEKCHPLVKGLYEKKPQNVDYKYGLSTSYERLGRTYSSLGSLGDALNCFKNQNVLLDELHMAEPQNVSAKNGLAISYSNLGDIHLSLGNIWESVGDVLGSQGNFKQALVFFKDFCRLEKELHKSFPQNLFFKNGLAISYSKLGDTCCSLGNHRRALCFFTRYNGMEKELHESYPENVSYKNSLATSYSKLGSTHYLMDNLDKALCLFEKSNRLEKELYVEYPQNVSFKHSLAISFANLARCFEKENHEKALDYFRKSEKIWQELTTDSEENAEFHKFLGKVKKDIEQLETYRKL